MRTELEFFFDPICPFCWVTSRWVVEVASQRELQITWRPLSLAILNEDIGYEQRNQASPEYPDSHARGLEMLRVVHAAREQAGPEAVGPLYTALGELVWHAEPPERDDFGAVIHEMARGTDPGHLARIRGAQTRPALVPGDAADRETRAHRYPGRVRRPRGCREVKRVGAGGVPPTIDLKRDRDSSVLV